MGPNTLTQTFCGSIAYLPPEIVKREGHGQAVDWYLIGELLYECIFGLPPYFNTSKKVLMNSIINDQINFPSYINRSTKDIILKLTDKKASQRLGIKGGVAAIKTHPFFAGLDWEGVYNKKYKLFDPKEIQPYTIQDYNQDIIDKADSSKSLSQTIKNWSVSRITGFPLKGLTDDAVD